MVDDPGIRWEVTGCPMCGSRTWSTLLETPQADGTGPRFAVVRCRRCDLCFTNPRPDPATIGQFYPADYQPHRRSVFALADRIHWWSGLTASAGRRCGSRCNLPRQGQCRLLDFGCGNGSFLGRMQQQGWQVLGLDVSEAAVEHLRGELGLPAVMGTLPHPELTPESFDVITMWQSLEHVHQPLEVLRHARELLVPGGKLIASVPNIDSGPFRWFGPGWYGLELPRHLTHFSPATLREMCRRAGFRVEAERMVRHNSWLRASARAARRDPYNAARATWLTSRPLCRLVTWYHLLTGQSDCIMLRAARP